MRICGSIRAGGAAGVLLAVLMAQASALADDKPAGELWEQTMSMEMTGMTMPSHTLQVCVPPGKADEALSKPQGPGMNGNCTLQDAKREGTRFTARFSCAGKQPVQGTIESVVEGDHARGTISMSMNGQQVTMKTDSHKIGTACTPGHVPGSR
ncbi:MAG TPA: DUF3617 family protein [Steroidobacteraceae bacterium]|nr:DUF3617 family protein [Steroidobacteraceae bacterium]